MFQNLFAESAACDIRRRQLCPNPGVHVSKSVVVFEAADSMAMWIASRLVLYCIKIKIEWSVYLTALQVSHNLGDFLLKKLGSRDPGDLQLFARARGSQQFLATLGCM